MAEKLAQSVSTYDRYAHLLEKEPKLVSWTVPDNADEQKVLFLSGQISKPRHIYSKMEALSDDAPQEIREIGAEFASDTTLTEAQLATYQNFSENYAQKVEFAQLMNRYRKSDESGKQEVAGELMKRNIEFYGAPDEATFRSLLKDALSKGFASDPNTQAHLLADEVLVPLHIDYADLLSAERYTPSEQTREWVRTAATELYEGFIAHVPDQETISRDELVRIWTTILKDEFGGAADEWQVLVEPAKAINVRASEKKIIIPEQKDSYTHKVVEKLTVHEIGIHAFRAITGASTDIKPLANGLVDYYDAEEGLGVVMEQALTNTYREAGAPHYITAGLAHFYGMDFRTLFETRWRINAIGLTDEEGNITEEKIDTARQSAYNQTMRSLRGTDELPWFKDLAYYNGALEIWKYMETIRGDEFALSLLLQGKRNTSKEHQTVILESHSV